MSQVSKRLYDFLLRLFFNDDWIERVGWSGVKEILSFDWTITVSSSFVIGMSSITSDVKIGIKLIMLLTISIDSTLALNITTIGVLNSEI